MIDGRPTGAHDGSTPSGEEEPPRGRRPSTRFAARLLRSVGGSEAWEGLLGDLEEEAQRKFGARRRLRRSSWMLLRAAIVALHLLVERGRRPPAAQGHDRPRRAALSAALAGFGRDVRYAGRSIRRTPGFAVGVALTLALGAGLNSTVFTITNALLLRDVPVPDSNGLVRLVLVDRDGRTGGLSRPLLRDLEEQPLPFTSLGAEVLIQAVVEGMEGTSFLGHAVTPHYFATLGVRAVMGRPLTPEDGKPGAPPAAVISHRLWRSRMGAAPDLLGHPLRLNGSTFTVVGVLHPSFTGTLPAAQVDVWVPLVQVEPWLGVATLDGPRSGRLAVFGRLAPGTSRSQAAAALGLARAELSASHRQLVDLDLRLDPPALFAAGPRRRAAMLFLAALQGLVLLVVLVAAASLANLFLARAAARHHETWLRLSLGASRAAVVRLVLCEALLLAIIGAAGAVVLGALGAKFLIGALPLPSLPVYLDLFPDLRVLAVTSCVAIFAALVVSLALTTALRRTRRAAAIPGGSVRITRPGARLRRLLVVAQVAISVALLASCGVLLESLRRTAAVDPGFRRERAFAMDLELPDGGTMAEAAGRRIYDTLLARVRSLATVEGASLADLTPLDPATPSTGIELPGLAPPAGRARIPTSYRVVDERYFLTLDIPILDGRSFDERDQAGGEAVAIVNRTMADRYWPRASAVGRTFLWGPADEAETPARAVRIVGVTADVKLRTMDEEPTPHFYLPFAQAYEPAMTLIVTTRAVPAEAMSGVKRALDGVPGSPQVFFPRTLRQQVDFALAPARLAASVAGALGALAIGLSGLGLFGVLSYSVALRRRELGLRMAMGAGRAGVARLVVGDGMLLVTYGVVAGILLAWPLRAALAGLLFGVGAQDGRTLAEAVAVLLAVGVLASWLPARRALGLSPADALREE